VAGEYTSSVESQQLVEENGGDRKNTYGRRQHRIRGFPHISP
jgi:hypothetical protein